jgi:hypothetical protein
MYTVRYCTGTIDYVDADSREAVYRQLGYTDDNGTQLYLLDEDEDEYGNEIHTGCIVNKHGDYVATIFKTI